MRVDWYVGGRVCVALVLVPAFGIGRTGAAFQRANPAPAPTPNYSSPMQSNSSTPGRIYSLDDSAAAHEMDEKRSRAMNSERQRAMVKEANQLVQAAAELQVGVTQGIEGAAREEQARRAETIEKLARNVKERMKGTR